MPTNVEPDVLVDSSVAIARILEDHEAHWDMVDALRGRVVGLSGHAAFESYSALTRMPPPNRLTAMEASQALRVTFPATRFLSSLTSAELFDQLAATGVAGGSVYDALVGMTAREHDVRLVTRDARAANTYRALGVRYELLT